MIYTNEITDLVEKIPSYIANINEPRKRGRAPNQAFSEFLTNREQGDWAESLIKKLTNEHNDAYKAVKYGRTDDIVAGEDGFKEFYELYQDELDLIGKKPDLVIMDKKYAEEVKYDVSNKSTEEQAIYIKHCLVGLEVRSSAFLVEKYEEFCREREGNGRAFLSFTPKAEDLKVIYKWIKEYNVPHYYIQVFFDRIYIISFKKILEIITDSKNLNKLFFIEKKPKISLNQQFILI